MKGDTICALCTAQGKGAVSLIRICGPKALFLVRKLADFLPKEPQSHHLYFGALKKNKEVLDQALVSYFAEGQSWTGEETLEISCHGGRVYEDILNALWEMGARPARRGEFSLRAFSNGKMDLAQAEGLLQLIEAESQAARRQALGQLRGGISKKLKILEREWLFLLSHLEADIDFSLEGLNLLGEEQIEERLKSLQAELNSFLSGYRPFKTLQRGLIFGIFGSVNAGKSSLFNALLKEDRAVVSAEEGTTRDWLEGCIANPRGLNICLLDSAGFRSSQSEGERAGQKKARELFFNSDYKIILLDALKLISGREERALESLKKSLCEEGSLEKSLFSVIDSRQKDRGDTEPFFFGSNQSVFLVFSKKDQVPNKTLDDLKTLLSKTQTTFPPDDQIFFVSSLTEEGLEPLRKKILSLGRIRQEDVLVSNSRHYKALKVMEGSLKACLEILKAKGEKDLMALELRRGLLSLYEILGRQMDDQVLDSIFKQFCIGK